MDKWAKARPEVQFLCVCVDTKGVAEQFSRMFGLESAVNCYIPDRRYFPVGYGQLGCSGFIVVDREGRFVSRKTKAYLQYGEAAFTHVEELLSEQLGFDFHENIVALSPSTQRDEQKEESKMEPPASVGVLSMDLEHEHCAKALALLLETLSIDAMRQVMKELVSHFDHEETLMKKHKFGQNNGISSFSPFDSHVKDHERILHIGQSELNRLSTTMTIGMSRCETV